MAYDSNRRALRGALPWLVLGFALLALSVGLPALFSAAFLSGIAGALRVATIGAAAGWVGSALLLFAAALLARARIGGRYGYSLVLFLAFWAAELALRLAALAGLGDPAALAAVRLMLAAAAMAALASGMLWIWDRSSPRAHRRSWILTRRLFLAQLAVLAVVAGGGRIWSRAPGRGLEALLGEQVLLAAAAWLVFAVPYAHLFVSLRRSIRLLSKPRTVADILTG